MTAPQPVVVVGAGPAGLMLALELAVREVPVVAVERTERRDGRLRAVGLTRRAQEALRRRDLLDVLRDRAGDGPLAERDPVPAFLGVRQERVEEVLEEALRSRGTPVRRGVEVTDVADDGDGVVVHGVDARGDPLHLAGSWAVGCDGGHSAVRRGAGFRFDGDAPVMRGYQALVEVDPPDALRPGWHRTHTGVVASLPEAGRVVSIEFDGPPDREREVTLEEVRDSVRRTSGADVELRALRSVARFSDNGRVADPYRIGRVLLAGDAAHVHPPFGGHGLNLSILDAVNLGWKLAAVAQGRANPSLLDTYGAERRPAAVAAVRNARAQAALWNPRADVTPAHELFMELLTDPAVAERIHETFSQTALRYDLGGEHPLVGRAAPDALLCVADRPRRLSTLMGAGHPVLVDLGAGPWTAGPVLHASVLDPADGDLSHVTALLVRPDGVVAWVATDAGTTDPGPLADARRAWAV